LDGGLEVCRQVPAFQKNLLLPSSGYNGSCIQDWNNVFLLIIDTLLPKYAGSHATFHKVEVIYYILEYTSSNCIVCEFALLISVYKYYTQNFCSQHSDTNINNLMVCTLSTLNEAYISF
jgi:hypothetical protein